MPVSKRSKPILIRITTLPVSMKVLLKGQPYFMKNKGFEVILISSSGPEVESLEKQESCRHISIPLTRTINPFIDIYCIIKLWIIFLKIKPDIVHTHTPKAGLVGMWAALLAGVPVRLHTIAGLPWVEYNGFLRQLLILIERITVFAANKVFPNSLQQKQFLINRKIGVQKLKVLGNGSSNGIDLDYFQETDEIIKSGKQLKILEKVKTEAWVWIFIGRLVKEKGVGELIAAFQKYNLNYPDDKLWLLGSEEPLLDPLTDEQKKLIKEHENIREWGFVKDVRVHLSASEVLVFPSYREGFPNVPLQAAAMGCCLLLSDINGCNEIVEDGKTGLLMPVKDADILYEAMVFLRNNPQKTNSFRVSIKDVINTRYDQQKLWNIIFEEYKSWLQIKNRKLP